MWTCCSQYKTCLGTPRAFQLPVQFRQGTTVPVHLHYRSDGLFLHVEKLLQIDTLPYHNEKMALTRSKQNHEAFRTLETDTVCVTVAHYTTLLLRIKDSPHLKALKEAVLAHLRSTERNLAKNPEQAKSYCQEVQKLKTAGYVIKLLKRPH